MGLGTERTTLRLGRRPGDWRLGLLFASFRRIGQLRPKDLTDEQRQHINGWRGPISSMRGCPPAFLAMRTSIAIRRSVPIWSWCCGTSSSRAARGGPCASGGPISGRSPPTIPASRHARPVSDSHTGDTPCDVEAGSRGGAARDSRDRHDPLGHGCTLRLCLPALLRSVLAATFGLARRGRCWGCRTAVGRAWAWCWCGAPWSVGGVPSPLQRARVAARRGRPALGNRGRELVTLHNIRDFAYRTATDCTPRYDDKTFDLLRRTRRT